jgi:hypothetical protein
VKEKKVQKRYNEEFKRQAVELLIRTIDPTPDTWFHVAGYHVSEESEPQSEVWAVHVAGDTKQPGIFRGIQAAVWNGELDITNRLMADVQFRWSPQNSFHPLPWFLPSWNFFTLQDAVDFAVFAVRTTIDTMRFLPRFRTVGGPIDVLVIKPHGAKFLKEKELRVYNSA